MGLKQFLKRRIESLPIFNPLPLDFYNIKVNGFCNVIVHPGYSNYRDIGEHNKTDKYGQYQEYLKNIKQIIKYLQTTGELTIFVIEDKIFQNKIQNEEGLSPFELSLIMITKDAFPNLDIQNWVPGIYKRIVKVKNRKMQHRPDLVYSFLKDNGIHEARFAGEWGWVYDGIEPEPGCVDQVAEDFCNNGLKIKGIEGCIYPTKCIPPGKNNEVLERFYDDIVEIPSILRRTSQ